VKEFGGREAFPVSRRGRGMKKDGLAIRVRKVPWGLMRRAKRRIA